MNGINFECYIEVIKIYFLYKLTTIAQRAITQCRLILTEGCFLLRLLI